MKRPISNTLIATLKPQANRYDVWDSKLAGFHVRVFPSGKMTYCCLYARGKDYTIGSADVLSSLAARERAKEILSMHTLGKDPMIELQKKCKVPNENFGRFIEAEYTPWVMAHKKTGRETLLRIKGQFFSIFADLRMNDIDPQRVEKWRAQFNN